MTPGDQAGEGDALGSERLDLGRTASMRLAADSPFSGGFGAVGFLGSFLGWLAASSYGGVILVTSWQAMYRSTATTITAAAAILVPAGVVATFDMDRFGLARSEPFGGLFRSPGAIGVAGVGLAWLMLGLVLVYGHAAARGTSPRGRR